MMGEACIDVADIWCLTSQEDTAVRHDAKLTLLHPPAKLNLICDTLAMCIAVSDHQMLHCSRRDGRLEIQIGNTLDTVWALVEGHALAQLTHWHALKYIFVPALQSAASFYCSSTQSHSSDACKVFATQTQAFEYSDASALSASSRKIYTFESVTGKRRFMVAQEEELLDRYLDPCMRGHRHLYEIIREDHPCRLYFDVEFYRARCPDADGEVLLRWWILLVAWKLNEVYGLLVGAEDVVDLDSSTSDKFSRHIIFLLTQGNQEVLFADNKHVGRFVQQVMADISEATEEGRLAPRVGFEALWPCGRDGEEGVFLVDLGVYTRNRAFRVFQSSKYGKSACLRRATGVMDGVNAALSTAGTDRRAMYKHILRNSYVLPYGSRPLPSAAIAECVGRVVMHCGHTFLLCAPASTRMTVRAPEIRLPCSVGRASPFPLLDAFVETLISKGGVRGRIRSCALRGDCLVFQVDGNRWCARVERPHRSNGVMIRVDLALRVAYQTCWDEECRGFRSEGVPVPSDVVPELALVEKVVGCT